MKRRILIFTMVLVISLLGYGVYYLQTLMPIITGYPARYLCSSVFITGRDARETESLDLNFSLVRFVSNEVDYKEKSVTSRFLWGESKAIFRERLGSVLVMGKEEAELRRQGEGWDFGCRSDSSFPWLPVRTVKGPERSAEAWNKMAQMVVEKRAYGGNPFAFLVIHRDSVMCEKYREGFSSQTRFQSWSMAKSFIGTTVGLMVRDSLLDLKQPAPVMLWTGNERSPITINHLMRMESGLEWNEQYGNKSDVTLMLHEQADFAGYAAAKPLKYIPGKHWVYSSGTTNILTRIMVDRLGGPEQFYGYIYKELFCRIGMDYPVFEADPTGLPVGSSYLYATARGFARFGLLYLHDGMAGGARILPEGWVQYATTPAGDSKGYYGGQFWLNRGGMYPDAPRDLFAAQGHEGQRIFIIPSEEMVVVVLGYSPKGDETDFNRLLKDVLNSINEQLHP